MGVHIPSAKLSYFSVPKCANSTLKRVFFEIENGHPYQPYVANGRRVFITHVYGNRPFRVESEKTRADWWKFAVIRDPVDRLVSCYRHRVLQLGKLDKIKITAEQKSLGVVRRPSFAIFVKLLEEYRRISGDIRHHSWPLSHFLGDDASFFDRIYSMSEIDEMLSDIGRRIKGTMPGLPDLNRTSDSAHRPEVTPALREEVLRIYDEDVRVFGAHMAL